MDHRSGESEENSPLVSSAELQTFLDLAVKNRRRAALLRFYGMVLVIFTSLVLFFSIVYLSVNRQAKPQSSSETETIWTVIVSAFSFLCFGVYIMTKAGKLRTDTKTQINIFKLYLH
jgi:hypothetical protein